MSIPDFIIHYSRGIPFRSITQVEASEWPTVIKDLDETNAWGLTRFKDPDYLTNRLKAEKILRAKFIASGGKPLLLNPIYFFLGRNAKFEQRPENVAYKILLKDLPLHSVSFTYGDSLLSFNDDYRNQSGDRYKSSLCLDVFGLEQIQAIFSHRDYPVDEALHIEAQLWVAPAKEIVKTLG